LSDLNEIGERDGWRCWLCDKAVDPDASVNSDLGPSADSFALAKAKKGASGGERLAHRMCNTMKGKHAPVVAWPEELIAAEPAPIVETVERLTRKGGRELVARFSSEADAERASEWLLDRLSRFAPEVSFDTQVNPGGGQFMLMLRTA
jgi:hypothetical protein